MYIREHVTMYLPKGHACCRFPCRVVAPFYKLYKVFPFPSSGGAAASRKSKTQENRNSTQVRPRSKLNAKLKTHVLGVNQRGYGWIGLALWLHFLVTFQMRSFRIAFVRYKI